MGIHIKIIKIVPIIINLCMLIGLVIYVLKAIKVADKREVVCKKSPISIKDCRFSFKNEVENFNNTQVIVLEAYKNKKMKK